MVPETHVESGFKLGTWLRQRRADLARGRLSAEKADTLAALPGWTAAPREFKFQRGLDRLRAYVGETGHSRVPATYVARDGFRLGDWVVNQRQAYRRGELPPERAAALEALPAWAWSLRR
jgi:hypothetical protein